MNDQELTPQPQTEAVYGFVSSQLEYGLSRDEVIEEMVNNGMDHQSAGEVVDDVRKLRKGASREVGKRNMVAGALWCFGGLAVTAITFQAASSGGVYVVTWGAVIFGAIQFLRGVGQMWGD